MWETAVGLILKYLPTVLGWFGIKGGETDREAGERLGKAEAGEAAAKGELRDIQKANQARRTVDDGAAAIVRDPDNAGPAAP